MTNITETSIAKPVGITDLVLRDAHQSLFATRMRLDDMLPIAEKLDQIGYWSLEAWGGATFDSCIRFLGEDPWDRLRELKKALPKTKLQMLLRGQNLLGYRHYSDDLVDKFIERSCINGMDIFRIFDAMNDPRNMEQAIKSVKKQGAHAQGTICFTRSPAHNTQSFIDLAQSLNEMGVDSIAIKDMSGILKPYEAFELVSSLKKQVDVELQLHCHATAGLSEMTILKAIEAGIDRVDTSISSMSGTYGHSATESIIAMLEGTPRATGLDINRVEEVSTYFREVRKKYGEFEGQLKGTDPRILIAQVPGGMLTNMESQLKQQNAEDKFDEVLLEIPKIRKELGYIPLVTPTSQIVGTQAVINVLMGERYKTITKETAGILKGEYGKAPADFDKELQEKVLNGEKAITCRPADLIPPELESLEKEVLEQAKEKGITLCNDPIEDVLTVALFTQVGWKFLENRGDSLAFEPKPNLEPQINANQSSQLKEKTDMSQSTSNPGIYNVKVNGQSYVVEVDEGGDISDISNNIAPQNSNSYESEGEPMNAPLAGNVWKILVEEGEEVEEGSVLLILEAMKMETEIRAPKKGFIRSISVSEGDSVLVGDQFLSIG